MNKTVFALVFLVSLFGCISETTELPEDNEDIVDNESGESQPEEDPEEEIPAQLEEQVELEFELLRKIEVADGYYPGIIFTNNQFYISYEVGHSIYVKIYDQDFNLIEGPYQLAGEEGPDHQMVFGNNHFYLVNSLYLRQFDYDFNEVKKVAFFDNLPEEVQERWPHGIDDMLLYYGNDSIYLGIAHGTMPLEDESGKKEDIPDGLYMQEYDNNLELKNEFILEDLGNTPASSMLFQDGIYTIVCADKHWDDSSLIIVQYDENWNEINRQVISAAPDANEEFAMGLLFENETYFVSYTHLTGDLAQPVTGEPILRGDVMLKAFDADWNLLGQIMVTEDIPATDLMSQTGTPHIALSENKIYATYDIHEPKNIKVIVKEYEIKEK